jgi:hypothetical protein
LLNGWTAEPSTLPLAHVSGVVPSIPT